MRLFGYAAVVSAACLGCELSSADNHGGFGALATEIEDGRWGNIHAVVITRDGATVFEEYFPGVDEKLGRDLGLVQHTSDSIHDIRSITKTVTATLVGIAIERGDIENTDERLIDLLPQYAELLEGEKTDISLEHVLTMSAGLRWDEDSLPYTNPLNDETRMTASNDPARTVLERELVDAPGRSFAYSGGLTHVLAEVLQEATGKPIDEFADEVLFAPLRIDDWEWMSSGNAKPSSFSGLRMRAQDLARFGSLFLNEGTWQGTQVVPAAWIERALQTHIYFDDSSAPDYAVVNGYSYQWWTADFRTERGILPILAAVGNGGQRVFVVPRFDVVIVILAGEYNEPGFSWVPEDLLVQRILPLLGEPRQAPSIVSF